LDTVRAFGTLASAGILGQVIGFVALAYVARVAGPTRLGAYTIDVALAGYAGLLANFGVTYLATRDVSRDPSSGTRVLAESSVIVMLGCCLAYAALAVGVRATLSPQERMLLPIVALSLFFNNLTPDWFLIALRRSSPVAAARLLGQIAYALLLVGIGGASSGIVRTYAWANVAGLLITALPLAWLAVSWQLRAQAVPTADPDGRPLRTRWRRSLSFGYFLAMLQLYASIAIPLLGAIAGQRAAGLYGVALRLPFALTTLATVWLTAFFPAGSAKAHADRAGYRADLGRVISVTLVLAGAVAVGASISAQKLIPLMFGPSYSAAALSFTLLAVAAGLVCVQASTSNALLALGAERLYGVVVTAVAICLIGIDVPLISIFGEAGAAGGAVIAEVAVVASTGLLVRRRLGGLRLRRRAIVLGYGCITIMAAAGVVARAPRIRQWWRLERWPERSPLPSSCFARGELCECLQALPCVRA
jgi:O-antigen/teichoic acid export membrane protein